MSLKKDLMEKIANSMVKMDKEEKKEFLEYVIDSMGEAFFSELTKEEKIEVMSESLKGLIEKSGLETTEEKKDLIVSLTEGMVDRFTGNLKPEERGEIMSDLVAKTIKKVGPEIKASVSVALKQFIESSPELSKSIRGLLEDENLRSLLKEFVKTLVVLLKDMLKNVAIEVYGYLKESGPEVAEFLMNAARTAIKALVRIGIELLRKAVAILSDLMQAGGKTLLQTKEWAEKVMDSDEFRSIKDKMETMVDENSERIRKLMDEGIRDVEELAVRTELPRATIRNILLKMWERGEVEMDKFTLGKPGGPSPG